MIKRKEPIAVVGMAGVFPGAGNCSQLCDNVLNKVDAIREVPEDRWGLDPLAMLSSRYRPDTVCSTKAGLISNFQFDPSGFNIDKDLLAQLDPLHHLVLHSGRQAVSNCFQSREIKEKTGVILAAIALPTEKSSQLSWDILMKRDPWLPDKASALAAGVVSIPAALLARAMGFMGGCLTLDAACASSLYSVKLACDQLNSGRADMMIAGGVSRPDCLYTQVGFTQLKALSPTGRCAPFDRLADGLVVGEGAGILVLKRFSDALACGDPILCIIKGAGCSNDIKGNLIAPASEGQIRAMAQAYLKAGWSPGDVQLVECHGSGTPVGDLVELGSMKALWQEADCLDKPCAVGSVKSMVGHLLTAAGAAGMIKTITAMEKGILPPSLNFNAPSPGSPLHTTRFKVQVEPEAWEPKPLKTDAKSILRRAGVSAFGFGGINAHLLLEAFKPQGAKTYSNLKNRLKDKPLKKAPVAIVGMALETGSISGLDHFKEMIVHNGQLTPVKPFERWRVHGNHDQALTGFWIHGVETYPGEFRLPPNQINDLLPQHLLMLKVTNKALLDAGISPRPKESEPLRTRFGSAIGIEFDYEATDFHLRWKINDYEDEIKEGLSPALSAERTLGALGGIVASRIAREFKLGGPCFTLSAGSASGLKAVETGICSLQSGETDIFISGCVDMCGDVRQAFVNHSLVRENSQTKTGSNASILPWEIVGEGAAAVVLKTVDQAKKDGDRIYGIIKGTGFASAGEMAHETSQNRSRLKKAFRRSLDRCLGDAGLTFSSIDHYESTSAGRPQAEKIEVEALTEPLLELRDKQPFSCSLGSTAPLTGNTMGVSGLIAMIKAAFVVHGGIDAPLDRSCLYQDRAFESIGFHLPACETKRQKPLEGKNQTACISGMTLDGAAYSVLIEKHFPNDPRPGTGEPVVDSLHPFLPTTDETMVKPKEKIILKTGRQPVPEEILNLIKGKMIQEKAAVPPIGLSRDSSEKIKAVDKMESAMLATAKAHHQFLDLTTQNMAGIEKQFTALTDLASLYVASSQIPGDGQQPRQTAEPLNQPAFTRNMCLEFATGKAGDVLGEKFKVIDSYPVRVRLPDEPLMLVDRIVSIEGEMLSLTCGKIVTQHDVKRAAWYLDGGRAPVSISIEAGQADLFLSSWLGIDHEVKGTRRYRLLDAKVTFLRSLPVPGETIEYHIEIDRFLKQGEVILFFFHYIGYIDTKPFISMRDGCAGFFTPEEVENSGGIILKKEDHTAKKSASVFKPPVAVKTESYHDDQVLALRRGDLETCFGQDFKGKNLGKGLRLPGGRMHLLDRVTQLEPKGGRFGLGCITAELDINPGHWFLTCHFVDDQVMPGTLMYECCAHTLRIFTQRMGWITSNHDAHYDVIPGIESDLKCRGPVTPETRKAGYYIEIKAMGYDPGPFVIADAHMFSDDHRIVLYKNMGMIVNGLTKQEITKGWS